MLVHVHGVVFRTNTTSSKKDEADEGEVGNEETRGEAVDDGHGVAITHGPRSTGIGARNFIARKTKLAALPRGLVARAPLACGFFATVLASCFGKLP